MAGETADSAPTPVVPVPDLPTSSSNPSTGRSADVPSSFDPVAFVNRPRFHQRLTLPPTSSHGELTVTYAVAGSQDPSAETMFFIGGMFGGRYLAAIGDYLGEKLGLRMVVADRPGMGGSTPVPVSHRLAVWLETVPALMRELNVEHVALAAHSCGVIYAFNTIYAMPEILLPDKPVLYLFAPFVETKSSGVTMLSLASKIPSPLIRRFDSIVSFINSTVAPSLRFSGVIVGSSITEANKIFRSRDSQRPDEEVESPLAASLREFSGLSPPESEALSNELIRRVFAEGTTGGNDEALLCLRKPEAGPWGACECYAEFPAKLDQLLRERLWSDAGSRPRVAIKAYFAETDMMIGKKGEEYFNHCFRDYAGGIAGPDEERCLSYHSETLPGTDHESICRPEAGALPRVVKEVMGVQ